MKNLKLVEIMFSDASAEDIADLKKSIPGLMVNQE
jgi:hypothetical protein